MSEPMVETTQKKKYDLPITRPLFGPEEMEAVQEPLRSGWVVQGPRVAEFERLFSGFVGARHSVATSSCTTALHAAVDALGLAPGDEVIVPAFTWVSTANVVEYQGATPVFCDVDLATMNLDPARLEERVTSRTVGIIPVHLFGLCADMPAIQRVASRRGLWMVEDAACALGSYIGERHAGVFGDAGCFSFHPRKSITTGEGGMVTTGDEALADRVKSLRDHGATRSDHSRHTERDAFLLAEYPVIGYNYRMTDLQGAVGVVQMGRVEHILGRRRRLARRYDDALAGLDWIVPPPEPEGFTHGYQSYVALLRPETPTLANVERLCQRRNALMRRMEALGIATRQGTHAPVTLGAYRERYGLRPEEYPNAILAESLSISLPLAAQMEDADADAVAGELIAAWGEL